MLSWADEFSYIAPLYEEDKHRDNRLQPGHRGTFVDEDAADQR